MKVFLTGATGVLGRELVRQLVVRGHSVVGTVRSEQSAQLLRQLGAEAHSVDLFDAEALARAADGCEILIHAATAIPTKARPSARDWEMNDRLRLDGTRALTRCAALVAARAYLQQSIVWVARPHEGTEYDENSPACTDSITQSALDGEELAREAGSRSGVTTMVLRCGVFYGAVAAHTRQFGSRLRKRQFPIIGRGDGLLTLLHVEDAAGAFLAALEQPRPGLWHVVDNEPAPVRDFLTEFARLLNAPPPRHVPVWLARLLAGKTAVEFLTSSAWTSNALFRHVFSWTPRYATFREGLAQVIRTWRQHEILPQ